MTDPGIYLVNSTGEMTPLVTEDDYRDEELYREAIEEHVHPYRCPLCLETIRSTGGGERLYETADEKNAVVRHNLDVFSDFDVREDNYEYLWYCPNEDCPIWRLLPRESDA